MTAGKDLVDILTKSYDDPGLSEVFNEGDEHYVTIISEKLLVVTLSISTISTMVRYYARSFMSLS